MRRRLGASIVHRRERMTVAGTARQHADSLARGPQRGYVVRDTNGAHSGCLECDRRRKQTLVFVAPGKVPVPPPGGLVLYTY
jgi:hypothetical protein